MPQMRRGVSPDGNGRRGGGPPAALRELRHRATVAVAHVPEEDMPEEVAGGAPAWRWTAAILSAMQTAEKPWNQEHPSENNADSTGSTRNNMYSRRPQLRRQRCASSEKTIESKDVHKSGANVKVFPESVPLETLRFSESFNVRAWGGDPLPPHVPKENINVFLQKLQRSEARGSRGFQRLPAAARAPQRLPEAPRGQTLRFYPKTLRLSPGNVEVSKKL